MAGIHADRGDKTHRLVSGETPRVGMRVLNNDFNWVTIAKVSTEGECGYYCEAWHTVVDAAGRFAGEFNCDRLTTRDPRARS